MIGETLRLNGSSRGRQTLIVLLSTKLELSQKVFNLISSNPNRRSASIGYSFYHRSEGKIFVAENGSFLEKEFLSKEVSGRKVELDEVTVPAPLFESSSSQKSIPVTTTPISEEVNNDDHETSD